MICGLNEWMRYTQSNKSDHGTDRRASLTLLVCSSYRGTNKLQYFEKQLRIIHYHVEFTVN